MKSWFPSVAILLFSFSIVSAAESLTGDEIRAAFSGNTLDGVLGVEKTPYQQYFDPSGWTTFVTDGGRPSQGRWWTKLNAYCSSWPPTSSESCYEVRRDGDRYLWVAPGGNALYPSIVLPGNQLN